MLIVNNFIEQQLVFPSKPAFWHNMTYQITHRTEPTIQNQMSFYEKMLFCYSFALTFMQNLWVLFFCNIAQLK